MNISAKNLPSLIINDCDFIILHRERKKNLDTYICEAHDSMVVCPEIAGFSHNVVA